MIEALLELQAASPEDARRFQCSTCPEATRKLRRCEESRWDFNGDDGAIFPLYVTKGGGLYGFCPGKATWDPCAVALYRALVVCERTGAHWQTGGIADQPAWWVEFVSDFLPRMDDLRFAQRVRAILGDGKTAQHGGNAHGNQRQGSRIQNKG